MTLLEKNVSKSLLDSSIATVFFFFFLSTIELSSKEFIHILQICCKLLWNLALSVAWTISVAFPSTGQLMLLVFIKWLAVDFYELLPQDI